MKFVLLTMAANVTTFPTNSQTASEDTTTSEEKLAVVCILSVLSVFGTFGNGLVLYVFSSKGNKVTSTIFILALAWTDFVTCLVIIPLTIVSVAKDNYMKFDFVCKLYHFLITFNVPLAAFIMVAIAVDRYFSICHPFLHALTPRRARVTVCTLCSFASILGMLTALFYSVYEFKPYEGGLPGGSVENVTRAVVYFIVTVSSTDLAESDVAGGFAAVGADVGDRAGGDSGKAGVGTGVVGTGSLLLSNSVNVSVDSPTPASANGTYRWTGLCTVDYSILNPDFLYAYQKVYASFYLISLLVVCIIYALIYRSVVERREWRRRQRSGKPTQKSPVTIATEIEEVEMRSQNGTVNGDQGGEMQSLNNSEKKASKERRDFNFLANIRTAAMLFVVTIVFILSFLPAWLMAVQVIQFHIIVFYLYFVYNVANPVIYAFMNHAFRKELKRVFQRGTNLFKV